MKSTKFFTGIFFISILFLFFPLEAEETKTKEAKEWFRKAEKYFKESDYTPMIQCLKKAVELSPTNVYYLEILAGVYRKFGNFKEAAQLLIAAIGKNKFAGDEEKRLNIALADTYSRWGKHFKNKYNYLGAIRLYEKAYRIDVIYRPKVSALELNNIGYLYLSLSQNQKALNYFQRALPIWRNVGNRSGEATTLNNIGRIYDVLGQNQKALDYYQQALPIMRAVGNRAGEATTLNNIGLLYFSLDQNQKALDYYQLALQICREVGYKVGKANALNNIGTVYNTLGQNQKALDNYQQALPIYQFVGNRAGEATVLNNIAHVYSVLGQKQKALDCYQQALQIRRNLGDRAGEANNLNNIGKIYDDLGQNQKALDYYQQALPIYKSVGKRVGEAAVLNNIAHVYSVLGQKQKTLDYYQQALLMMRTINDRAGEATTLNNIGKLYADLGQNQKALDYYQKALPIRRNVGDRAGEATTMNNLASVYNTLGQNQKALDYFQQALLIHRDVGDRAGKATTLNNIGKIYDDLGLKQKALDYYQQALPIHRDVGDRAGEATTLNNIGKVYNGLGQKQKALDYYQQALLICKEVGYKEGEATTLNNIGKVYNHLDQNQKALDCYQQALPIHRDIGDRAGEAMALNNIASAYNTLKQNQKALYYYQKALPVYQSVGNRVGEATVLNNIASVYSSLGQKKQALDYYQQALPIHRDVGNRAGKATTLNNIGKVYYDLGQKQKALDYLQQALLIRREVMDREGEANTLHNLVAIWDSLNSNRLAIFYGKHAVNALQSLRQKIDTLDTYTKLKYLESKKNTYRGVTSLLISSGRLAEAQQVLDNLKDEEYFSYIRRDRAAYTPQYSPIDYTALERKWLKQCNTLMEKNSSISNLYHELFIKPNKIPEEKKKLETLKIDMKNAQKEYMDFLDRMKNEFEKYKEKKNIKTGAVAKKAQALKKFLKSLDRNNNGKNVVLHFLVYKGQISVIITTPSSQTVKQSPKFNNKDLNKMIYNYRALIEKLGELSKLSRGAKPLHTSVTQIEELSRQKRDTEKKLYDIIFKPVDEYLQQYGAVNLIVSLDGVLRYIPLASLWDGRYYMLQKYRIALITPSSLKNIKEKPVIEKRILGLGASKGGNGFPPLPFVGREIRAIVKDEEKGCFGLITGNAFIDDDFNREVMISRLKTASYPLVHISSHFKFSPGNETNAQLLLGDGSTISLSEIRKKGKLFKNVKLMVLSACQTGMGGNGEEIDGFGELAQQCGVNSVIASLWTVDDESTKELMVKFYTILKEGNVSGTIEALRLAQLQLAGFEDMINKSKENTPAAFGEKVAYSQPYYWAPFIIMGSWR